ncbi:hypothetical protein BVC71_00680 [Marivivens niveibacter]|uniref:Branched-chain amino acid transporter n=1 Tax=Marivivens niveibacter TaxID=1930667 RepID=A0A251X0F3_9RHOB|nr:AzlD domain-containing protein [Marivivens niveibacter]OUD10066.1 hypothetical protein BVC71_00680 [Marivivens niveibacter]
MIDNSAMVWAIIAVLGVGTFLIRFSFLGLIGDRPLPDFLQRLLRYVPVAVLPALVAPQVVWPNATAGVFDPLRFSVGIVTLVVGIVTRQVLAAIIAGAGVLLIGLLITAGA